MGFAKRSTHPTKVPCDSPTGKSVKTCQALPTNIFSFSEYPNQSYIFRIHATEGRIAIVTDVGLDAMDADGAPDERANADDEVVWS